VVGGRSLKIMHILIMWYFRTGWLPCEMLWCDLDNSWITITWHVKFVWWHVMTHFLLVWVVPKHSRSNPLEHAHVATADAFYSFFVICTCVLIT